MSATARAFAALGVVVFTLIAAGCGRARRPNVLLLVMDAARADRCAVTGGPRPTTPCLDAFAKDAVVFKDAMSPANWTGPAHASLFTGLRPEHHGFQRSGRCYLGQDADTLAGRLGNDGYATACFSNNDVVSPEFGLSQAFQTFEPLYTRTRRTIPWARETHEEAAAWARAQADAGKPFFLFVNDMEPHLPRNPPADVAARFVRGAPTPAQVQAALAFGYPRFIGYDIGVERMTDAEIALVSDIYDASIATLDAEIGSLFDRLKADGLLDDTIVVVVGDHGENLGDHALMEHVFCLHRTLLHVPLVIRFPRVFDGGRVVADAVRLEDVYPTILEVCGARVPSGLDGVSLTHDLPGRVALGEQGPRDDYRLRIAQLYGRVDTTKVVRSIQSVHDGRFHLIMWSDGETELFDVPNDPGELHDIASNSRDIVVRLRAMIETPARDSVMPK